MVKKILDCHQFVSENSVGDHMAKKYTQFSHYTLLKRGKIWHFYYYENGTRVRKSTGKERKSDAEDMIADFFGKKDKKLVAFREFAKHYFIWGECPRVARPLSEGKSIGEQHVLKSRRWLEMYVFPDRFSDIPLQEIRRGDILDFRDRVLKATGGKINTANKVIATVKTVLSEAYFREEIERDPGSRLGNLSYQRAESEIFAVEEIRSLFSQCPGYFDDELAFRVFYTVALTGMRSGAVLALKWDAVEFNTSCVGIIRAWKNHKDLYIRA